MSTPEPQSPSSQECDDVDDDHSMLAVAQGDGVAFQVLFNRWKLPVLNFIYRSIGSHADAEDLTLMVFEQVWKSAPRYRAEGTFGAWLFAIARGKLKHEWRRRQSRIQPTPLEDIDPTDPKSSSGQTVLEEEELLLAGLKDLPDSQREALLMSVHSQMSSQEIAETLGVSTNHLYVLVHRAREQLKQFFEKHS